MLLIELFLAVCLHTELPCEDINVGWGKTPKGSEAAAIMYSSGRMEILFNPQIKNKPSRHMRTMIHEVAHLVVYQLEDRPKPYTGHGYIFKTECIKLSVDMDINSAHCRTGD